MCFCSESVTEESLTEGEEGGVCYEREEGPVTTRPARPSFLRQVVRHISGPTQTLYPILTHSLCGHACPLFVVQSVSVVPILFC